MFLFGLTTPEVAEMKRNGYRPHEYYMRNAELKAVIDQLTCGFDDGVSYEEITNRLLFGAGGSAPDDYMLLADFESYKSAHQRADRTYRNPDQWNRMSLINIARSGIFAADRSIRDYARDIWNVPVRD
jgi:starch phosphorylase